MPRRTRRRRLSKTLPRQSRMPSDAALADAATPADDANPNLAETVDSGTLERARLDMKRRNRKADRARSKAGPYADCGLDRAQPTTADAVAAVMKDTNMFDPGLDGAIFSQTRRDALWDKFYPAAPTVASGDSLEMNGNDLRGGNELAGVMFITSAHGQFKPFLRGLQSAVSVPRVQT